MNQLNCTSRALLHIRRIDHTIPYPWIRDLWAENFATLFMLNDEFSGGSSRMATFFALSLGVGGHRWNIFPSSAKQKPGALQDRIG